MAVSSSMPVFSTTLGTTSNLGARTPDICGKGFTFFDWAAISFTLPKFVALINAWWSVWYYCFCSNVVRWAACLGHFRDKLRINTLVDLELHLQQRWKISLRDAIVLWGNDGERWQFCHYTNCRSWPIEFLHQEYLIQRNNSSRSIC